MHSPKKDHQDTAEEPPTFKEQLDKEAVESRTHQHQGESGEHSTVKAVVDKSKFSITCSTRACMRTSTRIELLFYI